MSSTAPRPRFLTLLHAASFALLGLTLLGALGLMAAVSADNPAWVISHTYEILAALGIMLTCSVTGTFMFDEAVTLPKLRLPLAAIATTISSNTYLQPHTYAAMLRRLADRIAPVPLTA